MEETKLEALERLRANAPDILATCEAAMAVLSDTNAEPPAHTAEVLQRGSDAATSRVVAMLDRAIAKEKGE